MRSSQRAVLIALGFVVFVMFATAAWVRLNVTPGERLSGGRVNLTPALTDFTAVDVRGNWDVTITQGDDWSVALEIPTEFQDRFEARVVDGRLALGLEDKQQWFGNLDRDRFEAQITMPKLSGLSLSGASEVDFDGFDGDSLAITMSGAAEIDGTASRFDKLELAMSGAGDTDLSEVPVTDAEVTVSGAANVELNMAGGKLTGRMSGAGSLEYSGTVSEQSIATSGVVSISRDRGR